MRALLGGVLLVVILASGCAEVVTCRGSGCARIGWFTSHWLCECPSPIAASPPPAAPLPPPEAAPAPVVFVVAYRVDHPCLAHATRVAIDEAIAFMRAHPTTHAVIGGHADRTEPRPDWLANRRALVVSRYMAQQGIAAERLTARGFGATRPVADSTTPEGRKQNRRVEIAVSNG